MATRYIFKFQNDDVGPVNYQIVDADIAGVGVTTEESVAQMLCYFATVGYTMMGGVTRLIEVMERPLGAAGATPVPFPYAEYAQVLTWAAADGVSAAGMATGFLTQISAGGVLCPLGTSISVSERTSTVGPTGRGRHFLPFVGVNAVETNGSVKAQVREKIEDMYNYFFRALDPITNVPVASGMFDLEPKVTPANGATTNQIIAVKAQPVFSNLESRRR